MATDRLPSRLALGSTNAMWSRTATCRAPIGWATWYWMHRGAVDRNPVFTASVRAVAAPVPTDGGAHASQEAVPTASARSTSPVSALLRLPKSGAAGRREVLESDNTAVLLRHAEAEDEARGGRRRGRTLSRGVLALTGLLRRGGPWERHEATTALFELCKLPENRRRAVREGATPALADFAADGSVRAVVREAERVAGTRRERERGRRKRQATHQGCAPPHVRRQHRANARVRIRALFALCLAKENRPRAVAVGAASALARHVAVGGVGEPERTLEAVERLCRAEGGRDAMVAGAGGGAAAVATLVRAMSGRAAGALVAMVGGCEALQVEAVRAGAMSQLLMLVQGGCSERAKRKA
ncbi:U-box domain-containing protein 13-like [Miscanthus floridulus]|uniref:U-box domain-containing protein 13-like n=1 Tax=Miscanthus floridulus TaxID=154761 RepID=UPI00345B2450